MFIICPFSIYLQIALTKLMNIYAYCFTHLACVTRKWLFQTFEKRITEITQLANSFDLNYTSLLKGIMKVLDRYNILAVILLVEAAMVRQVAVWMNLLPRLNYLFSAILIFQRADGLIL